MADGNRCERVRQELGADGGQQRGRGLLDVVSSAQPALRECQEVSALAAGVGFEWADVAEVWEQVVSERAEFEAEPQGSREAAEEFGDLLFALVNVARWEGIDAEEALATSTAKFRRRWATMEHRAAELGVRLEELSTARQNELWNEAKAQERMA